MKFTYQTRVQVLLDDGGLKLKSFLSVADASKLEMDRVLARAKAIKTLIKRGRSLTTLRGKIAGLLFEKPSTRTRASFEVATRRLGGDSIYLAASELQLSRGEPVKDTARIIGVILTGLLPESMRTTPRSSWPSFRGSRLSTR